VVFTEKKDRQLPTIIGAVYFYIEDVMARGSIWFGEIVLERENDNAETNCDIRLLSLHIYELGVDYYEIKCPRDRSLFYLSF
jgi:hypothetical protein